MPRVGLCVYLHNTLQSSDMLLHTVCVSTFGINADSESFSVCSCTCSLYVLLHVNGYWRLHWEFDRGCVYVYTFNSSPYSHIHLLQSVSACLVSTLSLPLCLYRLWLSSSAQLADKIRACSACPVFPQYHILSLFSSPPLSKANECVCMSVCMCLWMRACVCVLMFVCVDVCAYTT